jgi:hypothetical protein
MAQVQESALTVHRWNTEAAEGARQTRISCTLR